MKRSLVLVLLCLLTMTAVAQMPQPFSADMTTHTASGQTMTGKLSFSPPKMRVDMSAPPGGQGPMAGPVSMIVDGGTQTSYMIMQQQHMYMEFHGSSGAAMSPGMRNLTKLHSGDPCTGNANATCKKLGTETVNGRSCDKWEVTEKTGEKSTAWVDQKMHFPVRTRNADGSGLDFQNIKEGAQDPSLFKVPAGYKPFDPSAFGGQRRPK